MRWPWTIATKWTFQPEWKEELKVQTPAGVVFRLDQTYAPRTVYAPCLEWWAKSVAATAAAPWQEFHDELADWCKRNRNILVIDSLEQSRAYFPQR